MTRAKARLFLTWRKRRMVFGQQSWGKDKSGGGAQTVDSDRSRFLDDIPATIVRTIDKTAGGGGSGVQGARNGAYGGSGRGGGKSESFQRRGAYGGGGGGGAPAYGGGGYGAGRGASKRGRGGIAEAEPERDPTMDFLTELSNSVSREVGAQRSRGGAAGGGGGGGYGSGYPGTNGETRYGEGSRGGVGRGAGYGGRGGGGGRGSYESESSRDARVFMEKRDKAEKARYPVPALRDGGKRMARDSGEGVDTSWAAKLTSVAPNAPKLPPGVVVGAQVRSSRRRARVCNGHVYCLCLTLTHRHWRPRTLIPPAPRCLSRAAHVRFSF